VEVPKPAPLEIEAGRVYEGRYGDGPVTRRLVAVVTESWGDGRLYVHWHPPAQTADVHFSQLKSFRRWADREVTGE